MKTNDLHHTEHRNILTSHGANVGAQRNYINKLSSSHHSFILKNEEDASKENGSNFFVVRSFLNDAFQ
jgi:hypothetical protein